MKDKIKIVLLHSLCASFSLLLVSVLGFLLFKCLNSNNLVEYCYVDTWTTDTNFGKVVSYNVRGHVSWRSDRDIADNLKTLDEAKQIAQTYGCELK